MSRAVRPVIVTRLVSLSSTVTGVATVARESVISWGYASDDPRVISWD